jgi:hypothetical protein
MPPRVRLIHWNAPEADAGARTLRAAGYAVVAGELDEQTRRALREDPPAAVVIDLARRPSLGRDVALAVRQYKATRRVALVLVGGEPDLLARMRNLLPDAEYTLWSRIRSALQRAIAHPPAEPAVPRSSLAAYAGVPLPKKLGIKADAVVALVGAPSGFERTLGRLPEGVKLHRRSRGPADLTLWFARSLRDLDRGIGRMVRVAGRGGLWIMWPKKTSRLASDLTQVEVRRVGLAAGLVDFKVCAVDETWTGLRFSRRG